MNLLELQVTLSFCVVFLLRMLGMFMVLPVLSKYAILFDDANQILIGLSIGIYGFAQIIFQIPFGVLSDKFGHKKLILIGLFIFFIGNVFTASINSIWGLIIGRFLQGSGAISGVCMALLSNLIHEKNRVKAMAAIGSSFALSFLISMITGPIVVEYFGFFSLFWISAFLSIICITIIFYFIPSPSRDLLKTKNINILHYKKLKFFDKNFFRFYLGIFSLHFLLMINFMIIPKYLEDSGLSLNHHWKVYLFSILISFVLLFLFVFYCKKKYLLDNIIEISIFFILCSAVVFLKAQNNLILVICALQIFFLSFNFLEIFLSSNLSKQSLPNYKGSIMSIYSTSQFLGIFFGGVFGGFLCSFLTVIQIFLFEIVFVFLWLVLSFICKDSNL